MLSEPASDGQAIDLYFTGRVTWHSSGEDEGPDVGLSLGLGDMMLWLGEMPGETGWWITLYSKDDSRTIAHVVDQEAARAMFDQLESLLAE